MPRGADGRAGERTPGALVVDEAIAWLQRHRGERFFLWVHLFEPHAPYGDARSGAPGRRRATTTRWRRPTGRWHAWSTRSARDARIDAGRRRRRSRRSVRRARRDRAQHLRLRHDAARAADPRRPGRAAGRTVDEPVGLVDVAPDACMRLLGLAAVRRRRRRSRRGAGAAPTAADATLYAESFAPLLDFGWSPLRAVRAGGWKYIAAPKPELYRRRRRIRRDAQPASRRTPRGRGARRRRCERYLAATQLTRRRGRAIREALARLQALGYASGSATPSGARPDPEGSARRWRRGSRRSRRASCTARRSRRLLRADPRRRSGQPAGEPAARLRAARVGRCGEAMPQFRAAIAAQYPSADAHLGLAGCQAAARRLQAAAAHAARGRRASSPATRWSSPISG